MDSQASDSRPTDRPCGVPMSALPTRRHPCRHSTARTPASSYRSVHSTTTDARRPGVIRARSDVSSFGAPFTRVRFYDDGGDGRRPGEAHRVPRHRARLGVGGTRRRSARTTPVDKVQRWVPGMASAAALPAGVAAARPGRRPRPGRHPRAPGHGVRRAGRAARRSPGSTRRSPAWSATRCSGRRGCWCSDPDSSVSPLIFAAIVPLARRSTTRRRPSRSAGMLALLVGPHRDRARARPSSASSPTCSPTRCRSAT